MPLHAAARTRELSEADERPAKKPCLLPAAAGKPASETRGGAADVAATAAAATAVVEEQVRKREEDAGYVRRVFGMRAVVRLTLLLPRRYRHRRCGPVP